MLLSRAVATLFAAGVAAAPFIARDDVTDASNDGCVAGLHFLVVRGTSDDPTTGGDLKLIYGGVLSQVPDSDVSQIIYPATHDFAESCAVGVANMRHQIETYTTQCPQAKLVLIGYSQGALVIGDLINGNGICGNTDPLDLKYLPQISSVVQVSDLAQRANAWLNRGSGAAMDGRIPRNDSHAYDTYRGKIASYCAEGDYYCAQGEGPNSGRLHIHAPVMFKDEAIAFITENWTRQPSNTQDRPGHIIDLSVSSTVEIVKAPESLAFLVGFLTILASIVSYTRTESVPIVAANVGAGVLYLLGAYRLHQNEPYGTELAVLASVVLAGLSIPRLVQSHRPLPAVFSVLALMSLVIYGYALVSG